MFSRSAIASTVYVPRTSVSPPSCMQKPPDGCFIRRKNLYSAGRSTTLYAAGSDDPRMRRESTAEYVGAQWANCARQRAGAGNDSASETDTWRG
jgi:hypothetical protein